MPDLLNPSPQEKAARAAVDINNAYRKLFSTEDGKTVLLDMLVTSGMLSPGLAKDPYEQAFREGQRSITVRIMNAANLTEAHLQQYAQQISKQREDIFRQN